MVLEVVGLTLAFYTMWPWNGNLNMVVSSKQLHVEKVEFASGLKQLFQPNKQAKETTNVIVPMVQLYS